MDNINMTEVKIREILNDPKSYGEVTLLSASEECLNLLDTARKELEQERVNHAEYVTAALESAVLASQEMMKLTTQNAALQKRVDKLALKRSAEVNRLRNQVKKLQEEQIDYWKFRSGWIEQIEKLQDMVYGCCCCPDILTDKEKQGCRDREDQRAATKAQEAD